MSWCKGWVHVISWDAYMCMWWIVQGSHTCHFWIWGGRKGASKPHTPWPYPKNLSRLSAAIFCLENSLYFLRFFLKTLQKYPLNKHKSNLARLFLFWGYFLCLARSFLKVGNENSAQSFSDRSFWKSLRVVDVRPFGSWMSAPKCLFFQDFDCPDRSFGPGYPREWPLDVRGASVPKTSSLGCFFVLD